MLKSNVKIKNWLKMIITIIKKNKIDYVIPGLDFELPIFSKFQKTIESECNCKIIISNFKIINIFRDKWKTIEYLRKNGFPYPKSSLPLNIKSFLKNNKFPIIVKPRTSSTSKNVYLTKNINELKKAIKICKNPIIQEYLYKNNNEYTCGVLFDVKKDKLISKITLNRELKNGNTRIARLRNNNKFRIINKFISQVTKKIKPNGPLNFQLCLTQKGPLIFEINPRFSGTTPFRALFGLNEVEYLLNALEGKKQKKIKINEGVIIRYFEDYFIKNEKNFL
jgi:carbamoyl-phosphate synthase large subunit